MRKNQNLKHAINKIDENMVNEWAKALVIVKTISGFKFQEAVLKKAAEIKGVQCRLTDNANESKGIDGYVGDTPVSIKPETYKIKKSLSEHITVKVIYYKKLKNGIEVDLGELFS